MITPLRREQMSVGMEVGLYEGGQGERLHARIERLDRSTVYAWVHDANYSTALPRALRGFLTALTYEQAEGGLMWAEPAAAPIPTPGATTGADLVAYLTRLMQSGLDPSAVTRRTAVRRVLAAQPDGEATDITTSPDPVIARYTAANRGRLEPGTLAQYASQYRTSRRKYLHHMAATAPDTTQIAISLGQGRRVIVTSPDAVTEEDLRLAAQALADRRTNASNPAPDTEPDTNPDPESAR